MKKLLSLFLMGAIMQLYAQENYKYIIIPRTYTGFKNTDDNPFNMSSNIRYLLTKKGIKSYYQGEEKIIEDPCDGLTVVLKNTSSFFKNKLRFILEDCRGKRVFSKEGTGFSKDFQKGYTEALKEALSGFDKLPYKHGDLSESSKKGIAAEKKHEFIETLTQDEYQPKNLYFNSSYTLDLVEENGKKLLKIINGKLLGYKKLQTIAALSSSGLDQNTYSVQWYTPQGDRINGIAKFSGKQLIISLSTSKGNKIIKVQKP